MSTGSLKKGKSRTKAVFVESSSQMTKSRNMAEENILRHKLKDLEVQRRKSILALKEEEKLLIKDLENQKRGSLTQQTTDNDKLGSRKDQLEAKYSNNSRRSSYISSDENDNSSGNAIKTLVNQTNEINNNNIYNRRSSTNPNTYNNNINDTDGRKHLWKHSKTSIMSSTEDKRTFNYTSSQKMNCKDDRLYMSEFAKDISSRNLKQRNGSDNGMSSSLNNKNDLSPRVSNRAMPSRSNSLLSRAKSIDLCSDDALIISKELEDIGPDKTSTPKDTERPTKSRTKTEKRRNRSMMSLAKRAGSIKWSSFEKLDDKLNFACGMIDKHDKKVSRSVNINIEEDSPKKILPYSSTPKLTSEYNQSSSGATNKMQILTNSFQNISLSSNDTKTSILSQSISPKGDRQQLSNISSQQSVGKQNPNTSEKNASGNYDCSINRQKATPIERMTSKKDLVTPMSSNIELTSSADFTRKNSVGRNKIMLSPIASRTSRSNSNGYVPSCIEKQPAKKPSKKKKNTNEKIQSLMLSTPSHVTSDSDSGGSNVSRKGSIPDSHRESSIPSTLDLPVRPVSSWSQRKRSIVFGERSPQTPREVLNDTHAQWEELGDFLGEIRKQHIVDHTKPPSSRHNSKAEFSPTRPEQQPRRGSNFATLVEQRLLPRRHSESNIILLSHAAKGKKDVLDIRQGATPSYSRRKSFIPPDHSPYAIATKNTSVKKLVTIHNALQTSAMSMADMEPELF